MPALPARADDTVTLWSWRTEDEAAMRRIFDVFEKANPGTKVDIQFTPDADYQNRLSTALRGGRGPDIAQLKAYGELQPFVEAGYLDALDDSVPELKNFPDAALGGARGRADGKLYGVPYSVPMMGVFYNQEIFAAQGIEIPKTYKDFVAACEKLKAAGITPIAAGGANGSAWALEIGIGVVGPTIYGPGFYDEMMSGKATFEDPRWVGAVKRYAELKPYFSDGFAGVDYTTSTQQFIGGKAAMFFGGSFENGSFKAQNPNLKFSIFSVPGRRCGDAALHLGLLGRLLRAGVGRREQGSGDQGPELHGIGRVRAALCRRARLAAGPHRRHRQGSGARRDDGDVEERNAVPHAGRLPLADADRFLGAAGRDHRHGRRQDRAGEAGGRYPGRGEHLVQAATMTSSRWPLSRSRPPRISHERRPA